MELRDTHATIGRMPLLFVNKVMEIMVKTCFYEDNCFKSVVTVTSLS